MTDEPRSNVTIPPEILVNTAVPEVVKRALAMTEVTTPCGMPYTVVWRTGPKRGLPVSAYCAEPLCIKPGIGVGDCTGPRFVPHVQQYTHADPQDPARRQRVPDPRELVEAAIQCGEKAARITKVKDTRSVKEIREHIAITWSRTRQAITGKGSWGPG